MALICFMAVLVRGADLKINAKDVRKLTATADELIQKAGKLYSPTDLEGKISILRQQSNDPRAFKEAAEALYQVAKALNVEAKVKVTSVETRRHRVLYQTMGQRERGQSPSAAGDLTDKTELCIPYGYYHIWCVDRHGKSISDENLKWDVLHPNEVFQIQIRK